MWRSLASWGLGVFLLVSVFATATMKWRTGFVNWPAVLALATGAGAWIAARIWLGVNGERRSTRGGDRAPASRPVAPATDDEMMDYIAECGPVEDYPCSFTITMHNIDEVQSLIDLTCDYMHEERREFSISVEWARSSTAKSHAQRFRILKAMQAELLRIAAVYDEQHYPGRTVHRL